MKKQVREEEMLFIPSGKDISRTEITCRALPINCGELLQLGRVRKDIAFCGDIGFASTQFLLGSLPFFLPTGMLRQNHFFRVQQSKPRWSSSRSGWLELN